MSFSTQSALNRETKNEPIKANFYIYECLSWALLIDIDFKVCSLHFDPEALSSVRFDGNLSKAHVSLDSLKPAISWSKGKLAEYRVPGG